MSEIRDSIYYAQLAKAARRLARDHPDPVVRRHLRETAIRQDRIARELARAELSDQETKGRWGALGRWLSKGKS